MYKHRIALLLGILLISAYPVLVKYMGNLASISAFYRVLVPAVCLLPILFFSPKEKIPKGKYLIGTLVCGMLFGLDIFFWNRAIEGSTATQATLLTNLAPIFVGVLAFLFLPNKPKRNFWIGAFIALVGMVVFIGWDVFINLSVDIYFVLGLLSALAYSVYIVISKMVLEKAEVMPYMALNSISATITLGVLNLLRGTSFTGFSPKDWVLLFLGGFFCQLVAWALISYATKKMRATRVSLSLLSQTVFAALMAYVVLNEKPTTEMLIGGLIIIVGIAITFIDPKPKKV
ncbi:DMT family transporter [Ornithobacterium rhinotracheale]|uniref:DMT family transporter n=1 Tax=Ornithobacterium rhinotracheale TaxID=28251 RepID=UPI003873A996